jgi:AAA domain-containing protein
MSPEPIRDYVGEALAQSANGKAATLGTDSAGDDAMSSANGTDFKDCHFRRKAREASHQERDSERREQRSSPPPEPQWQRGSFTAEQLQAMKFPPTSFLVHDIIPAEGVTLLCAKPKFGKSWLAYDLCIGSTMHRIILGELLPAQGDDGWTCH